MSLFVALPNLQDILRDCYDPPARRVIISETLHSIIAHRSVGRPLTLEAGIVRLADALDMAQGRSRIPFEAGHVNIRSVSAAAIESVQIQAREEKPVRIAVHMSSAAGIFAIDELLREKLHGSGRDAYVEVAGEADNRLLERFGF
jgi:hypothetical protein